jgi:hypothetical protein
LLLDREILVDDAEAALLRHRNREPRLGDGVHRCADERHVQPDVSGESSADVDLVGEHRRMLRHQQHVVEGERGGETGFRGRQGSEQFSFRRHKSG